jgi:hypothetical protein
MTLGSPKIKWNSIQQVHFNSINSKPNIYFCYILIFFLDRKNDKSLNIEHK